MTPDLREIRVPDPTGMTALGRRLRRFGFLLMIGALASFVWAVGFSRGVDGLLEWLVIAIAGFLVPAVALLWIGWVLAEASQDPDVDVHAQAQPPRPQSRRIAALQAYLIAIAAVALATMIRTWLTPYMSNTMLSPTFLLAVTVSAWVGGMGPAILATVLSLPVLLYVFLIPHAAIEMGGRTGHLVGLALFATVALSIGGIASALRLTQSRSASLRADVRARDAALDESELRFREVADEAPAMLRMCDQDRKCTFFNRAWLEFTGRPAEDEAGEGWTQGIHPQDQQRCAHALRHAAQRAEPYRTEYRLRRHDGSYRRVVDHGRPRLDRNGRFVGYVAACMEVADAPRLEAPIAPDDPARRLG
jgi:PAS domain S-box-containing protein